ncbi:MAG: phage tail assembly chaperone [Azoarcus sp.]|nr:phage tail assembly chaperone [Azoarcus sp.]
MPASGGYAVETNEETFHALKNSRDVFYDRAAGTIVALPEKPNAYSYYDRSARAWATNIAAAWDAVRSARGALLAGCDWTQLADAALSNTEKTRWQEYRQALRDITSQGGPLGIVWPVPPNS